MPCRANYVNFVKSEEARRREQLAEVKCDKRKSRKKRPLKAPPAPCFEETRGVRLNF